MNAYLVLVPGVIRYVVLTKPDASGRVSFDAYWWQDWGGARGQCFFGDVDEHVALATRRGNQVEVIHPEP